MAAALPAAERRSLAVQALLELAAETAPDQISTAAIALRMGTSHAALFRHFPSRDALWAESVRWSTDQLDQRPQASPAREEAKAFMARFRQRLSVLLAMASEQGTLRSPLPPAALANVLLACCEGLMLQALVHGSLAELSARTSEALPLLLPRVGP